MSRKEKKGKKSKVPVVGEEAVVEHEPVRLPPDVDLWVTVDFKLINWPFLKNAVRVKTSTPIFALKQRLVERHGRMSELKLYKGPPMRANLVENEMLTLEDLGVDGKPDDTEVREVVTMYYDFTPYDHDGPLLLVEAERHLDDAEDGAEVK